MLIEVILRLSVNAGCQFDSIKNTVEENGDAEFQGQPPYFDDLKYGA